MRFLECRTTRIIASFALFGVAGVLAMWLASRNVVGSGSATRSLAAHEMGALLGGACPGCYQESDTKTCKGTDACLVCTGSQDGSDPPACATSGEDFTNNAIPTQGTGGPMNKPSPVVVNCAYLDYNCNLNDPPATTFMVCGEFTGTCTESMYQYDKCRDCVQGTLGTEPIQMDGTFCTPCGSGM